MTHQDALRILNESDASFVIDEDAGTAVINGEVTIEELHALLQLLEYNDKPA